MCEREREREREREGTEAIYFAKNRITSFWDEDKSLSYVTSSLLSF